MWFKKIADQLEDEKKKEWRRKLLTSGLLLGGVGGVMAARETLSPGDTATAQEFIDHSKTWKDMAPREAGVDYTDQASKAIGVHPFGHPFVDTARTVRQGATLFSPSFKWDPPTKDGPGSAGHYAQFEKGPIPAYNTRNLELDRLDNSVKDMVTKLRAGQESTDDLGGDVGRPDLAKVIEKLPAGTEQNWNSPTVARQVADALGHYAQSRGIDTGSLSHEDQVKFLKDFDTNLAQTNPMLHSTKQLLDWQVGTQASPTGKGYKNIAATGLGLQKALLYGGIAAGTAGLGLAAYSLYKMLKKRKDANHPHPA